MRNVVLNDLNFSGWNLYLLNPSVDDLMVILRYCTDDSNPFRMTCSAGARGRATGRDGPVPAEP